MKKFITILSIQLFFTFSVNAGNEVEIKTSAIGKNKEDAIRVALRSAIEQVSGAYLTSSSTIINDELISENIESISNGNIKSYKINGEYLIDQSNYSVSITAIVSLNKIVEYCQQKGHSEVKVNGSLFASNISNIEMNRSATLTALKNIFKVVDLSKNNFYEYNFEMSKILVSGFYCEIQIQPIEENYKSFANYIVSSLKSLSLSKSQSIEYKSMGIPTEEYIIALNKSSSIECILFKDCNKILNEQLNKFDELRKSAIVDYGFEKFPIVNFLRYKKYDSNAQNKKDVGYENNFYSHDFKSFYSISDGFNNGINNFQKIIKPYNSDRATINLKSGKIIFTKPFDFLIDLSIPQKKSINFYRVENLDIIKRIESIKIYPIGGNLDIPPSIDNQTQNHSQIKIGNQVWMTQNLDVDHFNNGDIIPEAKSREEWKYYNEKQSPAWCYLHYNSANNLKFGKLYNWYAVNDKRGLAPEGWHVPEIEEWATLVNLLGGINEIGSKLKSKEGWEMVKLMDGKQMQLPGYAIESNSKVFLAKKSYNSTGFNALPGLYIDEYGNMGGTSKIQNTIFLTYGETGIWWSSSKFGNRYAGNFRLFNDKEKGLLDDYSGRDLGCGFSVRCIKN